SCTSSIIKTFGVCTPRIWNQGKAWEDENASNKRVCTPRIWNQGKAAEHEAPRHFLVCTPRIWNQGKADGQRTSVPASVCAPVFGIKAKRRLTDRKEIFLEIRVYLRDSRAQSSPACRA